MTDYLENALENVDVQDMNTLNEMIASSVRQGREVCPKLDQLKKKEPWEDEILQQKVKELRKKTPYKEARVLLKEIKNRSNELKNKYYSELANNINSAAMAREVEKEYAMAKKYIAIKKGQSYQFQTTN